MAAKDPLDKTILYITDSRLDPYLANVCRRWLVKNSAGMPIVSVSQEPLDFGRNICVGNIGRSGANIDAQLLKGLDFVETTWVAIAEHDCLYSTEHMAWIPQDDQNFYYNDNNWLLQYRNPLHPEWDGQFSYRSRRRVNSQLICSTDRLRRAMSDKCRITSDPDWKARYTTGRIAEPGCCSRHRTLILARRQPVRRLYQAVLSYMDDYLAVDFKTHDPNVDIRHGDNYTGQRRGSLRRFSLEPWGTMKDILKDACR